MPSTLNLQIYVPTLTNTQLEQALGLAAGQAASPNYVAAETLAFIESALSRQIGQSWRMNVGGLSSPASATVTFTGVPAVAGTITINGIVLTAVAATATPTNTQFNVGIDAATTAANLQRAIRNNPNISYLVRASVSGAVLTLTSALVGAPANALTLAETLTNATATSFTGGTDGNLYTIVME